MRLSSAGGDTSGVSQTYQRDTCLSDALREIIHGGVAGGSDPYALSPLYALEDDFAQCARLAGPWRAMDDRHVARAQAQRDRCSLLGVECGVMRS